MKPKTTPAPKGRNQQPTTVNRQPASAAEPRTLDDVERLLGELAICDATRRRALAEMDAEIKTVRDRYAATLDAEEARHAALAEEIASWAELHKEAFGEKRSLVLTHGAIGWRLGNPAIRLKPRVKAEQALQMVKEKLPAYVRTVEELDKAGLLAAVAGKALDAEDLAACGLRVAQTERFYCEPKTEGTP